MTVPCPGQPKCGIGVPHLHHSNGMVQLEQPLVLVASPPNASLLEQDPLVQTLRTKLAAYESRIGEAESRLVDLERRVAELWRRAM